MWPTSKGVRALDGAEALLVRAAHSASLAAVRNCLKVAGPAVDQRRPGVFDMLGKCDQKIVQLSIIAWAALLCNDASGHRQMQ